MDDGDILNDDIFQELLKASRQATKEDLELVEAMEALCRTPGWRIFVSRVLAPRVQGVGELILQPAGSTSGAWRTEFLKGALYGLCLARDMPSVIIASMRDVRLPQGDTDAS